MGEAVRAWVVVMAAAFGAYLILRPWLAAQLESPRLVNTYLSIWGLVITAAFWLPDYSVFYFLSGSLLLLAAIALGQGALGLYALMLFSLPMLGVDLSGLGIANSLFELTVPRLISLTLLVPIAFRYRSALLASRTYSADRAFVLFFAFSILLYMTRADSVTDILRSVFLVFIDALVPYFVLSRLCSDRRNFKAVVSMMIFSGVTLALVALVEVSKNWLVFKSLYTGLHLPELGSGGYELVRGGVLRVSGIFASPIVNGLYMLVILGLLSYASQQGAFEKFKGRYLLSLGLVAIALLATLSRGPLMGCLIFFALFWWWTGGAKKVFRNVLFALPLVMVLIASDTNRVEKLLGLSDKQELGNVTYRARLVEASIPVIERNLLLGSDDFLKAPELQPLRQGQGIIDIVNSYIQVTLQYGVLGLAFFVAMFVTALKRPSIRGADLKARSDQLSWQVFRALIVAFMLVIITVSRIDYVPYLQVVVLSLAMAWRRYLELEEGKK